MQSQRWRAWSDFLALKRNPALLILALLLAGTGEKLWVGFAPKYLQALGATVALLGKYDGLTVLLGALYAWPGGWLTDRWGHRRSLMLFSTASLAGYILVLVWQHWLALFVGAFLFLAWSALSLPATFSIIATSLQSGQHTMGVGVQSMLRRVPMMVGPLIGGWLIDRFGLRQGVQCALLICIGLTLSTMLFQRFMFEDGPGPGRQSAEAQPGFLSVVNSFSPALRELLISDILIRFCERLPYVWIIIWAMDFGGVSARQFGYLVTFEMLAAMLCYVPVAHLADRYGRRPFVLATFGFFTLFPLTLIWARDFRWLALAFVVRGLKEFGEPARKALIIGEAVPELRARTYGAYYLIRDCVVTTGSFIGAWLWKIGPVWNFSGAALFGAAGMFWFWWFVFRRGT
jgi:MFS family permease